MIDAFKLIWQCERKGLLLKLFYTVCTSLLPLCNLWVLKTIVDGAGLSELPETIYYFVALFCGIVLLNRWLTILNNVNGDVLSQKLVDYINGRIQNQSVRLDMSYYDNPDYHDTFHRAQQEAAFRPIRILENMVSTLGSLISLIGIAVMLFASSWQIVVVMIVAVVPSFCVRLYKSRSIYRFRRNTTPEARRSSYYGRLLSDSAYAKEVRSFGLADFFRQRYVESRKGLVGQLISISRRLAIFDTLTAIVEVASLAFVLFYLVRGVSGGIISIGLFVMLFEAFRRGQSHLMSLVSGISGLYEHKLFIGNLLDFLNLEPSIVSPDDAVPFPEKVQSVCFDNVVFAYPGMNNNVLDGFSMQLFYGRVNRIDGRNGFGKTTLLKLLLRLYDPQQGAVLINGVDIRRFRLDDLRRNVSVIFQDYVQFCFTAKENVVFGDIDNPNDEERLFEALKLAGADTVVDSLSHGADTMLGRQFASGEELSMGQWQRIALARQLYSRAPILVFDEPTSWMDATATANFNATLEKIKDNHLIILISHTV